jgi:hypothetical protein
VGDNGREEEAHLSKRQPDPESASELLADWRAAGRDVSAAETASQAASLALASAHAAETAAVETEAAALAAAEAGKLALAAAQSAKRAAAHAADAARLLLATAEGDQARADHEVELASEHESEANRRFHEAQERGFQPDPS